MNQIYERKNCNRDAVQASNNNAGPRKIIGRQHHYRRIVESKWADMFLFIKSDGFSAGDAKTDVTLTRGVHTVVASQPYICPQPNRICHSAA